MSDEDELSSELFFANRRAISCSCNSFGVQYKVGNSNMTSFVGYMNDVVIKLLIYFNVHVRIVEQIINIISN